MIEADIIGSHRQGPLEDWLRASLVSRNSLYALAATTLVIVAGIISAVLILRDKTQLPTSLLVTWAKENGLEQPVLLALYEPVHEHDRKSRTCYAVTPVLERGLAWCVADREELAPIGDWGGCWGDPELANGLSWCSRSNLKDQYELRFGDPEAFLPGMLEAALSHGIDPPQRVEVRGPDEECYRFGPEDDIGVWCRYERIKPGLHRPLSPCSLGFAGSFWCRATDALPPVDESWNWSWLEPIPT